MSRVGWIFNSYEFPINPEEDTGWVPEMILTERNAIAASKSNFQIGGFKSDVRNISGWIWGAGSDTLHSNYYTWFKNKTQATLIDHNGVSRTAMLVEYKTTAVNDIREWRLGRQTYKYTAKFVAV